MDCGTVWGHNFASDVTLGTRHENDTKDIANQPASCRLHSPLESVHSLNAGVAATYGSSLRYKLGVHVLYDTTFST